LARALVGSRVGSTTYIDLARRNITDSRTGRQSGPGPQGGVEKHVAAIYIWRGWPRYSAGAQASKSCLTKESPPSGIKFETPSTGFDRAQALGGQPQTFMAPCSYCKHVAKFNQCKRSMLILRATTADIAPAAFSHASLREKHRCRIGPIDAGAGGDVGVRPCVGQGVRQLSPKIHSSTHIVAENAKHWYFFFRLPWCFVFCYASKYSRVLRSWENTPPS